MQAISTSTVPLSQELDVDITMNLENIDQKITQLKNLLLAVPPVNYPITCSKESARHGYAYKSRDHALLHKYFDKEAGAFSSQPLNSSKAPKGTYLTKDITPAVESLLYTMLTVRTSKQKSIYSEMDLGTLQTKLLEIEKKINDLQLLKELSSTLIPKDVITKISRNGRECSFATNQHKDLFKCYERAFENRPLDAKLGTYKVGKYLSSGALTKAVEFDLQSLEQEKNLLCQLLEEI